MIKDLEIVILYGIQCFFDFFEDPVKLKMIDNIKCDALDMCDYVKSYYDNQFSQEDGVYSEVNKHEVNRQINAYNKKATEYNNKSYWYQSKLKPLSNWK